MVVCKYFQQGNCRFGQYCRFEHTTGFGVSQNAGNKAYGDSNKSIVLSVAEEALAAERGGQWLLSCFGPFKEVACIPGMDDISPEEVRWEMYQAKKNNTVEETNRQFQQLCQIMTAKRDLLKNPTQETVAMLEKLQKPQRDSNFASKSNSTLFNSPLSGSTVGAGIFGTQKFGAPATGAFGEGFSNNPNNQLSIFSRTTPSTSSVFGGKPSFGAFDTQKSSNSIFGGSSAKSVSGFGVAASASPFSSTVSAVTATETTTQSNALPFNTLTDEQNRIFCNTGVVFGDKAIVNNPPFGNPHNPAISSFSNASQGTSLFSNAANIQPGASIFGGASSNLTGGSSIFGQKTNPPFGGAPIFGVQPSSVFGNPSNFSNDGNIFAANNYAASNQNTFGNTQNLMTYGNPTVSTSENNLLGSGITTTTSIAGFGKTGQVIPANSNNSAPNNALNNTVIGNPFAPRPQETAAPKETVNPFQAQAFTQSSLPRTNITAIDPSLYSTDKDLSENDKAMFRAESFTLMKIPINPPTIELR